MFTADHGDLVMEHRQFYNMSMLEGSSHDLLLVMGPGVKSGQQLSLPGSLVDLYPTLLGEDWEARLHSAQNLVLGKHGKLVEFSMERP